MNKCIARVVIQLLVEKKNILVNTVFRENAECKFLILKTRGYNTVVLCVVNLDKKYAVFCNYRACKFIQQLVYITR